MEKLHEKLKQEVNKKFQQNRIHFFPITVLRVEYPFSKMLGVLGFRFISYFEIFACS